METILETIKWLRSYDYAEFCMIVLIGFVAGAGLVSALYYACRDRKDDFNKGQNKIK